MTNILPFGYLPLRLSCHDSRFSIETAPEYDESTLQVRRSGCTDEDWFWSPIRDDRPPRPTAWFALPATHTISVTLSAAEEEEKRLGEFLAAVLGFLYGILLTPGTWGNFYRVSINPQRWQDFTLRHSERDRILSLAADTWLANPDARDQLFGAVRWHTFSLSYEHPFEQFGAQYTVLDTCWRIFAGFQGFPINSGPHGDRLVRMANTYAIPVPYNWLQPGGPPIVVTLRNKLVHQAEWGGKPLGFGHPKPPHDGVHLELYWFNSRLIRSLLGDTSAYVHSNIGWALQPSA
jgi:hypothetical protein